MRGAYELAQQSPAADDHLFPLTRAELRASHQMTAEQEDLLADLQLTGSTAWSRLYRDLTARITAPVNGEVLPMSAVRALAYNADGDVRRAAYEAELAAWEANAVPIVAALNAIKGEAAEVNHRRGWSDDLDPALAANNVDRETLDAMQRAVVASFPDFRRYLRTKAQLLGRDGGLPFYDLFAPVVGARSDRPWEEATADVQAAFGSYSDRLEGLASRAVEERWIDAEPRDGKGSGAFCMGLQGDRSLVLLNYDGSFRSVQTLAHELGHAYHNVNLADRTPLQRQTPMALAETASIFCETIMIERGLAAAAPSERLALLEGDLQATCQVVVDIHSRFLFEQSFCVARARRTLSVAETCELMLAAQDQTYGEGLDPALRHPYMWAAKPHYYGTAFYNWPYTFGLLFGIGLYARYREDEERFRASYDDLLSSTGLGEAAELGARFGIDVRDEAFWTASLDVIRRRIDEFVELATSSRS
jgi:oligoendopeptidase F